MPSLQQNLTLSSIGSDSSLIKTNAVPELHSIIESFQYALNKYENILENTTIKLNEMMLYDEPLPYMENSDIPETPANTAIRMIRQLVRQLDHLNERAEVNLKHLSKII